MWVVDGRFLARGTTLALRASPRAALVVVVSAGPDKLVRDVVSLSGSCSLGTPPFVPTLVYAAVEGVNNGGGRGDGGRVTEESSTPAAAAAAARVNTHTLTASIPATPAKQGHLFTRVIRST